MKKLIFLGTMLMISSISYSQCPTANNIGSSNVTVVGDCSVTAGTVSQGSSLGTQTLTIPNGSTLTVNGNLNIYDNVNVYGTLIVNGDVDATFGANVYVADGGQFYVDGDYQNGGYITSGDASVDGDMVVTGTFTNTSNGSVDVGDSGSLQFGDLVQQSGSTMNTPSGGECGTGCCGVGCTPLPVKLVSFSVSEKDGDAVISWVTAQEIENDFFEIQKRSFADDTFITIGKVEGHGTTSDPQEYLYTDIFFDQDAYYRLKQVDFNGEFEIFDMIALVKHSNERLNDIEFYPNPTHDLIHIRDGSFTAFALYDDSGRLILSENNGLPQEAEESINQILAGRRGNFIIVVYDKDGYISRRLVKN